MQVRTRYAPSPTGFMHIGNLRTALYEYLIAKSSGGKFVLRIEDTDQNRLVEDAVKVIFDTLKAVGLEHDEGPDIGGPYGPYVQSERKNDYLEYAKKLVDEGKAYYCFCSKERLSSLREDGEFSGYDRHCRNLPEDKVKKLLESGMPYVIRQKVPLEGTTTFNDEVFSDITVQNNEIEDQILIKADLYPTYNFANVIDDHLMNITHIVRGCEYLSSTPKYNLLYDAFSWDKPKYVHLPLIMGKNDDGTTSKLSKRHGATSFEDLIDDGYLPDAIINYIALLGWCPADNREIFTLNELTKNFSIDRISKSPSVFDYDKLNWFNSEYIKNMDDKQFTKLSETYIKDVILKEVDYSKVASLVKSRINKLTDIKPMIDFFSKLENYDPELYTNKRNKTNLENSKTILQKALDSLSQIDKWDHDTIYGALKELSEDFEVKIGTIMWPVRIAVSGKTVTPGGAVEILDILGQEESINRIKFGIQKLSHTTE